MELITITVHTYSGPPGKIFKGPRSIAELAFFDYMADNPDIVDNGYIKVTFKHLSAVSHNKVPLLALNDCYKVLFFEEDLKAQAEETDVSEDDLELEDEERNVDESTSDLEENVADDTLTLEDDIDEVEE